MFSYIYDLGLQTSYRDIRRRWGDFITIEEELIIRQQVIRSCGEISGYYR
jgi:hypothetical protein